MEPLLLLMHATDAAEKPVAIVMHPQLAGMARVWPFLTRWGVLIVYDERFVSEEGYPCAEMYFSKQQLQTYLDERGLRLYGPRRIPERTGAGAD